MFYRNKIMEVSSIMLFSIIVLAILSGCILLGDENDVSGTGIIVYLSFEGGFYGIVADNGKHYDPMNLPSEFEENGLRVAFIGEKTNLDSFHMWGTVIELNYIEKLR